MKLSKTSDDFKGAIYGVRSVTVAQDLCKVLERFKSDALHDINRRMIVLVDRNTEVCDRRLGFKNLSFSSLKSLLNILILLRLYKIKQILL